MPLPAGGGAWPPKNLDPVFDRFAAWAAWWTGDPDDLAYVYGHGGYAFDTTSSNRIATHPSQYRGGVVGRLARWFWGEPVNFHQRAGKLHVPLAADIARTSAELLFAEQPTITVGSPDEANTAAQDRLNDLIDDGAHATFIEAMEVCAALGGVYLRICWDADVTDRPWLSVVHADAGVPEWRWGQLSAVTFWEELSRDEREVIRHLERHEPGYILHGVYKGTPTDLGDPVDLAAFPETAGLEPVVKTGVDTLTAAYIPNLRPNRLWRSLPAAAPMGRSDFAGIEPMMDALDEAWSSWMRDLRLGKARVLASNQMLESAGRGQGARFDMDRELFTGVDMLGKPGEAPLTEIQFQIRVTEHAKTVEALTEGVIRGSGYSLQTFGMQGEGTGQQTATEVSARQGSSAATRGRKIGYVTSPLASLLETLLAIDTAVFRSGVTPERPKVEFPDGIAPDPVQLAASIQALATAKAASTRTLVQMAHPDWESDQVDEEVARIKDEAPKPVLLKPPPPAGEPAGPVPVDGQDVNPQDTQGGDGGAGQATQALRQ